MEIINDLRNDLFKRKEIRFRVESEKNPSFDELRKKISGHFSKPEENIDVYNIRGSFGKRVFIVDAHLYDSKKDLADIKQLQKTQKKREEEKKAEEEEKKKAKADKEKEAEAVEEKTEAEE